MATEPYRICSLSVDSYLPHTESHCGDTCIVGSVFMCSISNFCLRWSLEKKCPTQALETHLEGLLGSFIPTLEKRTCAPKNGRYMPIH